MPKKNSSKKNELPEEPVLSNDAEVEDESLLEDEFDGPINELELEENEFDDWNPELEKIQTLTKTVLASKPAAPFFTPPDKKKLEEITVPNKFICSLSKQIMTEPVRIAGSNMPVAYEKSAIEAHYEETGTDPMTHKYLDDDVHFMPDLALKREIMDFCIANHICTEQKKHPTKTS